MKKLIQSKINQLYRLMAQAESGVTLDINVFIDGRTYLQIDFDKNEVYYSRGVVQSCGCCTEIEYEWVNINDLSEQTQNEILLSIE